MSHIAQLRDDASIEHPGRDPADHGNVEPRVVRKHPKVATPHVAGPSRARGESRHASRERGPR